MRKIVVAGFVSRLGSASLTPQVPESPTSARRFKRARPPAWCSLRGDRGLIRNLKVAATLALLCFPLRSYAAFEEVGVSARAAGMGNAFTAIADDASAVYHNTAGLATLSFPSLYTTYSRLWLGLEDNSILQNSFLAYAHPFGAGKASALGLAWNYFSLDSLYTEQAVTLGYGRRLLRGGSSGNLYGGLGLKFLSRSLSPGSVHEQPLDENGEVVPGRIDPVLEETSKTSLDIDLGLLFRFKRNWSLGAAVSHLLEPDMSFSSSGSDKLRRSYRAGAAYRTAWSNLGLDLSLRPSPGEGTDWFLALAGEKWFPSLLHGDFGGRVSLGLGNRELRVVTAGLSYRIFRMQIDYAFTMPLGTVSGTYGTHRVGFGLGFGGRAEERRLADAILESMKQLSQAPALEYRYRVGEIVVFQNKAVQDLMHSAQAYVQEGRLERGLEKIEDALSLSPGDSNLKDKHDRLEIIVRRFPKIGGYKRDPFQSALYQAVLAYFYGRDFEALEKFVYAQSLKPQDPGVKGILKRIQRKIEIAPERRVEEADLVEQKLAQAGKAIKAGDYGRAVRLCQEAVKINPKGSIAYLRLATAYYGQKRYPEVLAVLRKAHKLETDETLKSAILSNIREIRKAVEISKPRPRKPRKVLAREIESLYDKGVQLYSEGRISEAVKVFRRILEIAPGNRSAQRAVERIEAEMKQK